MEHTIDATNKRLGRLATEVAVLLMEKDSPSFTRHTKKSTKVKVENASKMFIDSKKIKEKTYIHHSGYPGGQRKETMADVIDDKGYSEVLRRAVYGMLPSNKLRKETMKNLEIKE